ncbi:MAG: hypothetical protein E7281_04560, partial [Lachnospiraceae bacterium]|nr:hypothetical protein [Lachnospiraceae bacterium]
RYEYSPNGNLIKVVDGLGNVAEYDYDALGNLIKVTRVGDEERLNQVTKYIWNKNGQVTDVINPAGERESYEYDLAGRMVKKTDRDGYETKIGYDKNSLLSRITYSDSSEVEFSYDALAHLKEMKDWNGTTSIVNDALGRALEVTDSNGNLVKYEWGANGEKRKLIYPNGQEVSYNYNDRGLLSELITENGKVAYDYDAMGRVASKTLPNGIVTSYEYNNIGRLSSLSHIGENIHDVYKYEYDLAGNKIAAIKERSTVEADNGRFEYAYDSLNQLISVTKDGKLQREYTYDAFGNRSSKKSYDVADKMIETVYKYNNKNQLLAETTGDVIKNYTYDLRGNIKTVTTGQDLIRNFTYDARNMLSEVSEKINGITQKASYNYNGLGKRMAQRVNTPSDPEKVIRYTLDLTRDYHNMLTLSTESEGKNQADNYFYDFNVVGMSRAVGDDYFIQDDLGSPMSVINQLGELDEAYAYDEFGQEYANIIDARERFQPLSYTGYQKEAVGDTYFAQARRYDASIGRFVSEDKVDTIIDSCCLFNKYAYCINNPYSYVDLNGLWPKFIEDHKEAIGIGLTVAGVVGGIAITALSGGLAAPFVAGAVVGATGYLGDKIYNNEEATVGGFVASTLAGAATGFVNFIPGAGSKLVSTFGGKVLAIGEKALASGVIEGGGKIITNIADGTNMWDDVAETAISAAVFSGVAEGFAIKKKGTIDTKEMRSKLVEETQKVDKAKQLAHAKWESKIDEGVKNAKSNLQKELTKINKLITVPAGEIAAIERAFKQYDIKSDIVFSGLDLAEDGICDYLTR